MSGELLADEVMRAETQLIQYAQHTEFREEWKALIRGKPLPSNSKLLGRQPKVDDDGLLRSDGRLKHAKFLSCDVRHPVILPRRSWVTKLIIKEYHEKGQHATELIKLSQHFRPDIGYPQHKKQYGSGKKNARNVGGENQGLAHK